MDNTTKTGSKKSWIYLIDGILIIGTLMSLMSVFYFKGYEITGLITGPVLNSPENGSVISQAVLFSFDYGNILMIDDNLAFSHPQEFDVQDNLQITLEPGVYYWMVKGEGEKKSEIREFTVQSRIELKLRKSESGLGYEVVNAGNTKLNVDVYEGGQLTGKMILDVNRAGNAQGDKFIGGQAD